MEGTSRSILFRHELRAAVVESASNYRLMSAEKLLSK
jgi:hypothetical protein